MAEYEHEKIFIQLALATAAIRGVGDGTTATPENRLDTLATLL